LGFVPSATDTSLFIYRNDDIANILLYVDNIVLTASSDALLQHIIESLNCEFAMTDLGDLHDFLHMSLTRSSDGLFLCQRQYALEILRHAGMSECHSMTTPVDTKAKLSASYGSPVADVSAYRSLAGAL
jgi:hypothetical protein